LLFFDVTNAAKTGITGIVSGSYVFHADTQTIEWLGGMFKSNNWGGKLVKKENGFKIEFNKSTFGESRGK
jgi:hypothetical protein